MECFAGVQVESAVAGTGSIIGVVDESSVGVAVDTNRWIKLDINSGEGRASSNAASSSGIVSFFVLSKGDLSPNVLIESG